MADFYALQIRLGNLTLEDIPERFRESVKSKL